MFYTKTGIAHGLSKPSALFSQDHDVEKLPDLAGYAVHSYTSREKTDRENARGLVRDLLQEISLNPEKPRDPVSEQLAHVSLTETGGGIGHRDGPLSWDRLVDGDPSYSAGFDALGNAQLQMESLLADGAGGYTYSTGAGSYLDDGALLLGHLGEHASASILPAFAANVAVEVQLSIRDFGPDETHWVGIQFRGFDFGVGRGYMVYLRATGQVEVQSPEGSIWSVDTVPFERGQWVTLRVAIVGTRMLVEVPGLGKRELRGLNYVGPGRTALQSYWVAGAFRAVKVWLL